MIHNLAYLKTKRAYLPPTHSICLWHTVSYPRCRSSSCYVTSNYNAHAKREKGHNHSGTTTFYLNQNRKFGKLPSCGRPCQFLIWKSGVFKVQRWEQRAFVNLSNLLSTSLFVIAPKVHFSVKHCIVSYPHLSRHRC